MSCLMDESTSLNIKMDILLMLRTRVAWLQPLESGTSPKLNGLLLGPLSTFLENFKSSHNFWAILLPTEQKADCHHLFGGGKHKIVSIEPAQQPEHIQYWHLSGSFFSLNIPK